MVDKIFFNIYCKDNLEQMALGFDGCPLKDEDGNIIGKVIDVEYDGEKFKVEAKIDNLNPYKEKSG